MSSDRDKPFSPIEPDRGIVDAVDWTARPVPAYIGEEPDDAQASGEDAAEPGDRTPSESPPEQAAPEPPPEEAAPEQVSPEPPPEQVPPEPPPKRPAGRAKRPARPRRKRTRGRMAPVLLVSLAVALFAGVLGGALAFLLRGAPSLAERPETRGPPGAKTRADAKKVVVVAAGKRYPCTAVGTPRGDSLTGTEGDDVVCGRGGDDRLRGLDGDDVLVGGRGDDHLVGGPGRDRLSGGRGADTAQARDGWRDHVDGGPGADRADAGRLDRRQRVESFGDPVVVAAGDIACDPLASSFEGGLGTAKRCHQRQTAQLVLALEPDAVLVLGDAQYEDAEYWKYLRSYDPTWGRFKQISHPTPGGSHDRFGGGGYRRYWGARAGPDDSHWYSFDIGGWHLVSLDSNCSKVGSCDAGSPQEQWLRADLAAHPAVCTLAFWHEPRFSSLKPSPELNGLWRTLSDFGAELVLSGDSHNYERFRPRDVNGPIDPVHGIRQFVVGTGGKSLQPFTNTRDHGSVARSAQTYGVLELRLHPTSYNWRFVPEQAGAFTDAGSAACR